MTKAKYLTMVGNSVAGSEKIGFKFAGTDCNRQSNDDGNPGNSSTIQSLNVVRDNEVLL